MRRAMLLCLLALVVLPGGPASAEEPLDDLVVLPTSLPELRREPVGAEDFYTQEAGVRRGEILAEVSILPTWESRGPLILMRGSRFTSAASAERAARALMARGVGTLRPLGPSLGDGFVTSYAPGDSELVVHDAFRLRGRDLFSYVAMSQGTSDVPPDLIELVAWHAETFPGSAARAAAQPGMRPLMLGSALALASASGVAMFLISRRRSPTTRAADSGPSIAWTRDDTGWSSRPVPPSPPLGDGRPPGGEPG